MINGMLESSRGCLKEEIRMDTISNNLANSSVIGFKKNRISFQQMLEQVGQSGEELKVETGDHNPLLISIKTDMSQGDMRSSGNELDVAIFGKGFFKVNTPDGIRYTRKGNFALDPQGNLTTQNGYMVMGKGGPINISGNEISIDVQGSISVDGTTAGQLDVVDLADYEKIVKQGRGLFSNASYNQEIAIQSDTRIKQGALELSNVNIAEEMVSMIHSLRAFESYQKAIKVIDELDNRAINQVGRVR
jgi:flagellar basal-body rod protein FlgF